MARWCLASVFGGLALSACASARVQSGLANAPALPGASHETRVTDVIANGRDACERSAFPQGEVLRGHVPPCESKETRRIVAVFGAQRPSGVGLWLSPAYPRSVCPRLLVADSVRTRAGEADLLACE